jgi:hypothetical protein
MIRWREAYERQKDSPEFKRYFGQGKVMPAYAFRPLVFGQSFTLAAGTTSAPTNQPFPMGAIILGITASAFQGVTGVAAYANVPSFSWGRRDLFDLAFSYSGDENLTPGGPIRAEALLGGGFATIFPGRELLIAPSQNILATVRNRAVAPDLIVDIAYHTMVPRAVS